MKGFPALEQDTTSIPYLYEKQQLSGKQGGTASNLALVPDTKEVFGIVARFFVTKNYKGVRI